MSGEDFELLVAIESAALAATEEIAKALEQGDITQRELAARAGVSEQLISRIMQGRTNMTLKTLARVAYALGREVKVEFVVR